MCWSGLCERGRVLHLTVGRPERREIAPVRTTWLNITHCINGDRRNLMPVGPDSRKLDLCMFKLQAFYGVYHGVPLALCQRDMPLNLGLPTSYLCSSKKLRTRSSSVEILYAISPATTSRCPSRDVLNDSGSNPHACCHVQVRWVFELLRGEAVVAHTPSHATGPTRLKRLVSARATFAHLLFPPLRLREKPEATTDADGRLCAS